MQVLFWYPSHPKLIYSGKSCGEIMKNIPKHLMHFCEMCGEETKHRVLKGNIIEGKVIRFTGVLKCLRCGNTKDVEIIEEKPVMVTVNISAGESTKRDKVEFESDEVLEQDAEIVVNGRRCIVTKIEANGRSVPHAPAKKIDCLWLKDIEQVKVKIAVNDRELTMPYFIFTDPDEEFAVGNIIDTDDGQVVITAIKTKTRRINRENDVATASEIVRIYCRRVT